MRVLMCYRMKRGGLALLVVAAACAVVAFIERHVTTVNAPSLGITGAYFDRNVGAPAHIGPVPPPGWFDPIKPLNPYLWIGLAVGLAVSGVVLLSVARAMRAGG